MVLLLMYLITLSGNFLVITVVRINPKLHTPMYFFLSNLSVLDICFSSTIVPRLLINTLSRDRSISLLGCALQMYFHLSSGANECVILAVMAYDRYVAICMSLWYMNIMSRMVCAYIAIGSWGSCFINAAIHVGLAFHLPFSSHLTVVSIYYGTILSLYLRPHSAYSPEVDKVVSLIYTAVTPMLNLAHRTNAPYSPVRPIGQKIRYSIIALAQKIIRQRYSTIQRYANVNK
ncbi:hypothetical protein GDO81_014752 [Engystomops pustulosus]|uniref:G-protein coupled receptors family 1 profile domain-containing protein n=1 Tax=Engystomops pustulosus TaxID=76066 RepID=A0AAV7AER8_ENGPU|nr:hypothetical protein GDO81_014752 [Engystomops pustulosus]